MSCWSLQMAQQLQKALLQLFTLQGQGMCPDRLGQNPGKNGLNQCLRHQVGFGLEDLDPEEDCGVRVFLWGKKGWIPSPQYIMQTHGAL